MDCELSIEELLKKYKKNKRSCCEALMIRAKFYLKQFNDDEVILYLSLDNKGYIVVKDSVKEKYDSIIDKLGLNNFSKHTYYDKPDVDYTIDNFAGYDRWKKIKRENFTFRGKYWVYRYIPISDFTINKRPNPQEELVNAFISLKRIVGLGMRTVNPDFIPKREFNYVGEFLTDSENFDEKVKIGQTELDDSILDNLNLPYLEFNEEKEDNEE